MFLASIDNPADAFECARKHRYANDGLPAIYNPRRLLEQPMPQLLHRIQNQDVALQNDENPPRVQDVPVEPMDLVLVEIFDGNEIEPNAQRAQDRDEIFDPVDLLNFVDENGRIVLEAAPIARDAVGDPAHAQDVPAEPMDLVLNANEIAPNAQHAQDRDELVDPVDLLNFVDENARVVLEAAPIARDAVENQPRIQEVPAEPIDENEIEPNDAAPIAQDIIDAEPILLAPNNDADVVCNQEEVECIVIESDDEDITNEENAASLAPSDVKLERVKVEDQDMAAIQILIHGRDVMANVNQHGDATLHAVNEPANEASGDDDVVFFSHPPPAVFAKCECDDISGFVPFTTNVSNMSVNTFLYVFSFK